MSIIKNNRTLFIKSVVFLVVATIGLPLYSRAQNLRNSADSLHFVLDQVYDDMMPLCSQLIGVGQGLAGFAALWYISSRVWKHLANAEPIDFYPLFRPFVIGFAIMIFPSVLAMINGVMKPTVTATGNMVKDSDKAISVLLKEKDATIKRSNVWEMYVGESGVGDRDKWYKYTHDNADPSDEGMLEGIGYDMKFAMEKAAYNFRNSVKEWLSEILQLLFQAAALCIDTIRTFQMIVMAVLGPLVFGLSVFDGFQHTLTVWLARYINIYLWLPVANLFGAIIGKIQEKMLALDVSQIQNSGDTFFSSTDAAYLVFLIIGIVGYFTVPSIANYIVNAGGSSPLVQKITTVFHSSVQTSANMAGSGASMAADAMGNMASRVSGDMSSNAVSNGYFNDQGGDKGTGYMKDKLSGKS